MDIDAVRSSSTVRGFRARRRRRPRLAGGVLVVVVDLDNERGTLIGKEIMSVYAPADVTDPRR